MRSQKIRGHRRRHKDIEQWRKYNLPLNFNLLKRYNRDYAEIIVHPWCDISIIRSTIPFPRRKTKALMLSALLDIYDSWKIELDKLGEPYYLKIWLFEPRFSKSQVVCAIGEQIDFYESRFFKPESSQAFKPANYGSLKPRLEKLNWELNWDENHYGSDEVGEPEAYKNRKDYEEHKRWFAKQLKKPHRTESMGAPALYSIKQGNMWIGGNR